MSRLTVRLAEVRAREAEEVDRLADTRAEAVALADEVAHMSRGVGPVSAWNAANPMGAKISWFGARTTTRSAAWLGDSGQAMVLVVGSLLPVALEDVTLEEVVESPVR